MYWIIKHKPTGIYYGVRRVYVSFSGLAHRFGSVRRARSYITENGLNSSEYSIISALPHGLEEKGRFSAQQLTDRLFNELYGRNREY